MFFSPFLSDPSLLKGHEDDNPISLLVRRMQVPVVAGIGTAIVVQASKGVLNSPALFGRIAYTTLPMCGIGFYYLTGTYIAERIRKEEGPLNHVIGAYCTFPLLRKFLPLSYTTAALFFVTLPLYAVVDGFRTYKERIPIWLSLNHGVQMTSCNLNEWLENMSSEPYVKRESYNLFAFPSK